MTCNTSTMELTVEKAEARYASSRNSVRLLAFICLLLLGLVLYPPLHCITITKGSLHLAANANSDLGLLIPNYQAKPGRFLYLVTSAGDPGASWIALTQQPGVYAIFATWKHRVGPNMTSSRLEAFYFPNSTWTGSRNFLFSKVAGFERRIMKRMHFIVFADDDLALVSRSIYNPRFHVADTLAATLQLHDLLMRDRPARAGVEYAGTWENPIRLYSTDCVRSCALDGVLDVYHRSIVEYLLPYEDAWDSSSWHLSQFIMNLRSQSLLPNGCNLYREIFIDTGANRHGTYPTDNSLLHRVAETVTECLVASGFQLARGASHISHAEAVKRALGRPKPGHPAVGCAAQPVDVNYASRLAKDLRLWPRSCSG
eukprot:scpid64572/ scgid27065/ 